MAIKQWSKDISSIVYKRQKKKEAVAYEPETIKSTLGY